MSNNALINYEENNWQDLAEKFIERHQAEWDDFVMDEFENNLPEPPDHEPEYDTVEEKKIDNMEKGV